MNNIIPYFKFPTRVVFLDDDELFLESLKKYITHDDKLITMLTDPTDAYKKYFANNYSCFNSSDFLSSVTLEEADDDEHTKADVINYHSIINLMFNKKRFLENSVFVVDYSMPIINGMEFFEKIKDSFAKKIMLTGYDDYKLAVKALNNKLIDKYIIKEIDEIKKGLNQLIDGMIWEYFCDFSKKIQPLSNIHTNINFGKIFTYWLRKNNIIEFYQCDDIGSYIGLNAEGDIFWFLLTNEKQLHLFQNIALNAGANTKIIDSLKSKNNLLFLFSEDEKKQPISSWNKYIFPIHGNFNTNNEIYFYSFLEKESFSINKNKIVPFKNA